MGNERMTRNIEQEIQSTKPNVKVDPEDEKHNKKWRDRIASWFPTVTPEQMRQRFLNRQESKKE